MKKITILSITASIFSFTYLQAAEGHSHDLPEFLHFLEELVEEHGILRGFVFGFIHTLIPLIGFYSGWSINRFLKVISNGAIAGIVGIVLAHIIADFIAALADPNLKSAAYGIVLGGFLPLLAVPLLEKYVTKSQYHTVVGDHEDLKKDLIRNAERDGSISHGLFRLPAYVSGLKSGKINGKGKPEINKISPSVIKVQGNNSLAPVVLSKGLPELSKAAKENGVAVLAINNSHHMAAMWPETEKLAEDGLVAFACTSYKPAVAPAGAIKPLFGTNPISFAWPRPGQTPVVYDMATASMAMGEVQVAKREGHKVPLGTGLTKDGKDTTDPAEIADGGVLLPFGGYKGSAIAMMVELLAGALVGDNFSYETAAKDNNDGGPPSGGEFILAICPDKTAGTSWQKHAEEFFEKMKSMGEVRLPGERRHKNRLDTGPRHINEELVNKIKSLS
jgi:delta1-piperideine-2-carboxylate reductase